MILHHVPKLIPKIFPQFIWHKNRSEKKIYLTFDDGPVEGVTDYVLKLLQERNMKATFFMVGDNVRKNVPLARRVATEGHQVGNHTFHHLNGFKTSSDMYLADIYKCRDFIKEKLGFETLLFRPPYGRITLSQFKGIRKSFQVVMWDVLSGDFEQEQSAQKCLSKTKKYCQSGSIVVFHDQEKTKDKIKKVLNPFLDYVVDNGFETDVL